jgi:hypothetical protein
LAYEISPETGLRFWDVTPETFAMIADGYIARSEREWYRAAWVVAHLMSPHLKKGAPALKPHKLLGWDSPSGPRRRR